MKKLLVVLLAVAMIFCFAATAMATTYSDMADQSATAQDDVAFISALGVVAGYPDGTFGPAKNITRAEFAKIAVNAAGLADSADYMNATASKFSDVKVGAWYNGYVNLAQGQGYIKGYPDGTFRPNATITNQEVITVLMRMLGYDDRLTGPWPIDYINKAVKLGIMDDVKFVGAAPATRVDVAIMTKATLDEYIVGWDSDKNDFLQKTKLVGNLTYAITLLEDSFKDGKTATGYVNGLNAATATNTKLDMAASYSEKNLASHTFTLNVSGIVGTSNQLVVDNNTEIKNAMPITALAGQQVTLIFDKPGKDQIIKYVDVKSTVKAIDKVEYTGSGNKIVHDPTDPTNPAKDTVVAGSLAKTIKLGGVQYDVAEGADVNALINNTAKNVSFYAFFNDDNDVYAVVSDKDVKNLNTSVVDTVTANGKLTTKVGNAGTIQANALILKNGKQIAVTDLAKYDVLTYNENNIKDADIINVQSMASGKLNSYKVDAAKIDGTSYNHGSGFVAKDVDDSNPDLTDYVGKDVKYVLNGQNEIVFLFVGDTAASNTVYGVVTSYTTTTSNTSKGNKLSTIDVFNKDGKTVTYKVNDKYALFEGAQTAVEYKTNSSDNKPMIARGSFVKFTVDSDGTTIKSALNYTDDLAPNGTDANVGKVSSDDGYFYYDSNKKANVTDKTVIFNVYQDDSGDETSDVDVELMTKAQLLDGDLTNKSIKFESLIADTTTTDFITVPKAAVILDGVDATYIIVADASSQSATKYGMIEALGNADEDGVYNTVKFYGDDTVYKVADAKDATFTAFFGATPADYEDHFMVYTKSGKTVYPVKITTNGFDGEELTTPVNATNLSEWYTADLQFKSYYTLETTTISTSAHVVDKISNNLVKMNNKDQFTITKDTKIFEVTMKATTGVAADHSTTVDSVATDATLSSGDHIQYILNDENEAVAIVIVTY